MNVYSDESWIAAQHWRATYNAVGPLYLPQMSGERLYMQDRLGRGGDHTPFQQEGYAAVRISTPNEILANQHHAADTLENMSVPYTARVAS